LTWPYGLDFIIGIDINENPDTDHLGVVLCISTPR
jgi:hypothetical protein